MGEKRARRTNLQPSRSTPLESRWKYLFLRTHSIAELELPMTSLKRSNKLVLEAIQRTKKEKWVWSVIAVGTDNRHV